jgi:hypothetical protein
MDFANKFTDRIIKMFPVVVPYLHAFLNMFKNSKECATLDEEQQNVVLQQFNDMLSSDDTVEQIVEDVFYKDGKNYNSECYENSDSDSDNEDNMDAFSKSFKQTKKTFKEMKGGKNEQIILILLIMIMTKHIFVK